MLQTFPVFCACLSPDSDFAGPFGKLLILILQIYEKKATLLLFAAGIRSRSIF